VEQFRIYIDGLDRWLANNREKVMKVFQAFDVSGNGKVTHDQFKAGTLVNLIVLNICTF